MYGEHSTWSCVLVDYTQVGTRKKTKRMCHGGMDKMSDRFENYSDFILLAKWTLWAGDHGTRPCCLEPWTMGLWERLAEPSQFFQSMNKRRVAKTDMGSICTVSPRSLSHHYTNYCSGVPCMNGLKIHVISIRFHFCGFLSSLARKKLDPHMKCDSFSRPSFGEVKTWYRA